MISSTQRPCRVDLMENRIEASPLQLKQLLYSKIQVEAVDTVDAAPEDMWAPAFNFEGVVIDSEVLLVVQEGQEEDPRDFMMLLNLSVRNDSENGGKLPPYTFDIHSQAWFEMKPIFDIEKRESLVRINGASMIVSAMRELLTLLTARSSYGPMTLPSLRFLANGDSEK